MKALHIIAALALPLLGSAAELTEADYQKQAVAKYPSLMVKTSQLHARFLEMVNEKKARQPGYFNDPIWPLWIASLAAEELGIQPTAPAVRETSQERYEREKRIISESQMRMAGTSLDHPVVNEKTRINGYVLQRLKDGVLVACQEAGTVGVRKAKGIVFVRGAQWPDDSGVNLLGIPAGTYSYTAVSGAVKIVDAFTAAK